MLSHDGARGIDTNVILRAVLQDDDAQSPRAQRALLECTPEHPAFITMITLAEVYWVLTRTKDFGREAALAVLRRLVESDSVEFDDGEGVVRALLFAEEGADFADAMINSTFEQFGITQAITFDRRAAERLGWHLLE